MFLRIDPEEPEAWLVVKVADVLRRGGVAVVPTDTIYALAASIDQPKAIERLYAIKGLDPKKPLSILLPEADSIGKWVRTLPTTAYRVMKRVLPGAYTFILPASSEVPRIMLRERKTIGIRVPDNPIVLALLAELHAPLIVTSIRADGAAYVNDPLQLEERFGGIVDVVVDGGPLPDEPSTIIDLTGRDPVLVRAGKGDVDALAMFEPEES